MHSPRESERSPSDRRPARFPQPIPFTDRLLVSDAHRLEGWLPASSWSSSRWMAPRRLPRPRSGAELQVPATRDVASTPTAAPYVRTGARSLAASANTAPTRFTAAASSAAWPQPVNSPEVLSPPEDSSAWTGLGTRSGHQRPPSHCRKQRHHSLGPDTRLTQTRFGHRASISTALELAPDRAKQVGRSARPGAVSNRSRGFG